MLTPAFLALLLSVALLALLPARRLHLAGWPGRAVLAYVLVVVGLAIAAVEVRAAARFLVPILVVAYLAPFVTVGDGLGRLLGTQGASLRRRPPEKNVTPPLILLDGDRSMVADRDDEPLAEKADPRGRPGADAAADPAEDSQPDEPKRGEAEAR